MEHKQFIFETTTYEQLIQYLESSSPSCFKFSNNQNTTTILIMEEYYFRISSNLTITLIINKQTNNKVELHIIASGGKQGLFEISWGAEKSALKKIIKLIEKYNPLPL